MYTHTHTTHQMHVHLFCDLIDVRISIYMYACTDIYVCIRMLVCIWVDGMFGDYFIHVYVYVCTFTYVVRVCVCVFVCVLNWCVCVVA